MENRQKKNFVIDEKLYRKKFADRVRKNIFFDDISFDKERYEIISSLNKSNFDKNLIKSAQKIIVGTLTPPEGMENGYYYSSSKNRVFGVIDICFQNQNYLSNIKKQLIKNKKDAKLLKQIEKYLHSKKLAFVDVIDRAIRVKNSSKDDDILFYSLDYDAFKLCNKNQLFICTSMNAKNGLLKILEISEVDINRENIFVCYQDRFHYNKQDWLDKLT